MTQPVHEVRAGFIGGGRYATSWGNAFSWLARLGRCRLTGLVEPDAGAADTFCRQFDVPRVSDIPALAAAVTNLWFVCTPTANHLSDVQTIARSTSGPAMIVVATPVALVPGQVRQMERLEGERVRIVPANELRYAGATWLQERIRELGAIEAIEAQYQVPTEITSLPRSAVDVVLSGGGVGMELMPDLLDLITFLAGGSALRVTATAHRRRMPFELRSAENGLSAHFQWFFGSWENPGTVAVGAYWGDEWALEIHVHGEKGSIRLVGRGHDPEFVLRAERAVVGGHHEQMAAWRRYVRQAGLIADAMTVLADMLRGDKPGRTGLPTLSQARKALALIHETYRAASTRPPQLLQVEAISSE